MQDLKDAGLWVDRFQYNYSILDSDTKYRRRKRRQRWKNKDDGRSSGHTTWPLQKTSGTTCHLVMSSTLDDHKRPMQAHDLKLCLSQREPDFRLDSLKWACFIFYLFAKRPHPPQMLVIHYYKGLKSPILNVLKEKMFCNFIKWSFALVLDVWWC